MISWLKALAIPGATLAFLAFAAPSAHGDSTVTYSTQFIFANGGGFTAVNGAAPTNGGGASVSTLTFGSPAYTLTYTGEANLTKSLTASGNVPLGTDVATTFGNFTSNVSAPPADFLPSSDAFTLNVYEWAPQITGPGSFSGSISGYIAVNTLGDVTLTFNAPTRFLLPPDASGAAVWYSLGDRTTEQVTPNDSTSDNVVGDVAAAPLPKTAGMSLTLFGLLGLAGVVYRKRTQVA